MRTCSTCRFWVDRDVPKESGFKVCDLYDCIQGEKWVRTYTYVHDDSGLSVNIMTHKDHGCKAFEGGMINHE